MFINPYKEKQNKKQNICNSKIGVLQMGLRKKNKCGKFILKKITNLFSLSLRDHFDAGSNISDLKHC